MSGLLAPDTTPDLFRAVREPPGPSEAEQRAAALAEEESARSEKGRISSIQEQLAQETVFRRRGFGLRSLLGPLGTGRSSLLGSG